MSLPPPPLTDRIAAFVADTPAGSVPAAAFESAKLIVLDTLGVGLAACTRPIGRIAVAHARAAGGPAEASLLGDGLKLSAASTAFANGILCNAFVFEEGSHLSTHVLPVALALAERDHRSGRDMLDAFIVGYEVGTRLTQAIDGKRDERRGPTYRGWWHSGLVGPLAAAATAARLLGLDRRKAAIAIGIASCSSGGFRRNAGTMSEPLHSGNGARSGIEAAELAGRGFTADPEIIEAPLGFLAALTLDDERDQAALSERLGKPFVLEAFPRFKPFPTCTPIQVDIQAVLDLRRRHAFEPQDVEQVFADLHPFSLVRMEATDENNAGFCGAYLLATALVHGRVGFEETSLESMNDPVVQALARRVEHRPPKGTAAQVTVRLRNGEVLGASVEALRRPKNLQDLLPKFADCAGRMLNKKGVVDLREIILRLDDEPTLDSLMALAGARQAATA